MSIQGIGSQDAWSRFMKLTQDARLRNSGLTGSTSTASASKPNPASSVSPQKTAFLPAAMTYSRGAPDVKKVIVGGRFDAYA